MFQDRRHRYPSRAARSPLLRRHPERQRESVVRRSRADIRCADQELVVVLERYLRVVGNRKLAAEQPAAAEPDAEGEDDAEQEQVEGGEPASGARA